MSRNWADSLNMMTANLRRTAYAGMQKDNLIGKVQEVKLPRSSSSVPSRFRKMTR